MPPDDDVFREPSGELPEHYAAIGRLITGFSNIERALNIVLRQILGLSEETGRAITGEMRSGDLAAAIKRIVSARHFDVAGGYPPVGQQLPQRKIMDALFGEIDHLKKVRDDISHRRFFVRDRQMVFTNSDTARSVAALSHNLYSIEDLNVLAGYAARLHIRVNRLLRVPERPASVSEDAWARSESALLEIPPQLRPVGKGRRKH